MEFKDWLLTCLKSDGSSLSFATAKHYDGGAKTVSDEMMAAGVIAKPLFEMSLYELDVAIAVIFKNPIFLKQDKKGNCMYSNSLKKLRCFVYATSDRGIEEAKAVSIVDSDPSLSKTERETIVKARIGQGKYREDLIKKYGCCLITGLMVENALRASHIKPWSVCNNKERIDVENGFLLAATYDCLFDSGLISFKDTGEMMVSNMISKKDLAILGIDSKKKYSIKFSTSMGQYLDYHRNTVFLS